MLEKFKKNQEQLAVVAPYANIYEQGKDIVLSVEMPGVEKGTIDVNLNGNLLVIQARKMKEEISKEYKPVYQERFPVAYERRFEINTEIDRDAIEAEYKNGILKVSLAKSEAAQPQKIAIKT
ncbi:MAG TPA: Hsp20/alpha crystallin family protein [Candidatus Omnitrophota bacterium]|jgi:HSP20 family protein|nr:Hsp20/alpha crystallin family protein [Candidatus Omnitrophota bacterium]HPN57126.1 Hsp20/alpha crystallin family protein [Candidatus Omnitrophota bacterium]